MSPFFQLVATGLSTDLTSEALKLGILGPILVGLAIYAWTLHKELRKAEQARVTDAQAVTATLLELNQKWAELITNTTQCLNAQRDILERIEEHRRR